MEYLIFGNAIDPLGCVCYGEGAIKCGDYCNGRCNEYCVIKCITFCNVAVCGGAARRLVP